MIQEGRSSELMQVANTNTLHTHVRTRFGLRGYQAVSHNHKLLPHAKKPNPEIGEIHENEKLVVI